MVLLVFIQALKYALRSRPVRRFAHTPAPLWACPACFSSLCAVPAPSRCRLAPRWTARSFVPLARLLVHPRPAHQYPLYGHRAHPRHRALAHSPSPGGSAARWPRAVLRTLIEPISRLLQVGTSPTTSAISPPATNGSSHRRVALGRVRYPKPHAHPQLWRGLEDSWELNVIQHRSCVQQFLAV